ncbi:MAG: type II secretion system GspH family protein [Lentisphaeraceae bacterium]|nr:type II secretion system GspH family protein [Lentisphaeraceae bacterium]
MSRNTKPFKSRRSFTMVELLAVITITAILLTITLRVVKVDSVKANITLLGSALNYAQAYSMSQMKDPEDFIEVRYVDSENNLLIIKHDYPGNNQSVIETYSLRGGTNYSTDGTNPENADHSFFFNNRGEPIKKPVAPINKDDTNELETTATNLVVYMLDSADSNNKLEVFIKPFTGKIAYY